MSNPGALGSASIGGTLVPDVGGAGKGALGGAAISGSVGGLHQVVVAGGLATENYGGFGIDPGGPHVLPWGGGGDWGGMNFPSVIQDTDGYSGTIGTMVDGGIITSLVVPPLLGGNYRAGFEIVNLGTPWFLFVPWEPYPHDIPYIPSYGAGMNGEGVGGAGFSVEWAFYVNGGKVGSSTWVSSGIGGFSYQVPAGCVDLASIALAAGDSVTSTVEWSGGLWPLSNFTNSYSAWGSFCVMYLTRIGGGAATQHGPTGTGHYGL